MSPPRFWRAVVHSKIKWSSRSLPSETDPTLLDMAKRLEQLIRQSNDPEAP
jgi:hypothetical protein